MIQLTRFLAALLITGSLSTFVMAAPADETPEARAQRIAQALEVDPTSEALQPERTWLLGWIYQNRDLRMIVCDIFKPIQADDYPYAGVLVTQMIIGNAAFQLRNPDRRTDHQATQLAGVESGLKAYAKIIDQHPDARLAYLDDLLAAKRLGNLPSAVASLIDGKCNLPKEED